MGAKTIRRVLEPPVEGASRVYRLVPADVEDPAEWLATRLAERGLDLVDIIEFDLPRASRTWIAIDAWAVQQKQPASAAGGGS